MKTIYLKTNYNNKLACSGFVHIDVAPKEFISESKLAALDLEIRTADNSHPPVKVKLVDLLRVELFHLSSVMTYPSHGVDAFTFAEKLMKENSELKTTSPMAVYYYVRQE